MIRVLQLTAVTDNSLQELNELMRQLREGQTSSSAATKEEVEEILNDQHIAVIAAKDHERVVGVATLYIIPKMGKRIGHIEDVVVSEEYRGQGIGSKMIQEVLRIARERGVGTLSLTSRPERVAGNKLYQKMGFERKETNVYRLSL